MGVDVSWIVLLENPHPEEEWKMIEALERRDAVLAPRLSTTRDKRVRTLTIPSFVRWEKISSETNPTHRHPQIAKELAEIQEIIGDLPLYYSNDISDGPGDWLTEDELYELLETMVLADGTFALVADLLAEEAKILGKITSAKSVVRYGYDDGTVRAAAPRQHSVELKPTMSPNEELHLLRKQNSVDRKRLRTMLKSLRWKEHIIHQREQELRSLGIRIDSGEKSWRHGEDSQ